MATAFGELVTKVTVDSEQMTRLPREMNKIRREITQTSQLAAQGDQQANLRLVSLIAQEEHLGDVAKRAAEIEATARRQVIGVRAQEIQQIQTQETAQRRLNTVTVGGGLSGGRRINTTQALLELSRGAEDAAVSFGTAGLQGALRGSANNLAAFATIINPMAGVVTGVGVALASILVPRLLDTSSAADEAKKSLEELEERMNRVTGRREGQERLTNVQKDANGLEEQRKRVAELRNEYSDLSRTLIDLNRQASLAEKIGSDDVAAGFRTQAKEVQDRLRASTNTLTVEEFGLRNAEAADRRRKREADRQQELEAELHDRLEFDAKHRMFRRQADERERKEQQRRVGIADDAMGRSVIAGLMGGLRRIDQQRDSAMRRGVSSDRPEAVERANSTDKIMEIRASRIEREQEKYQQEVLKKHDAEKAVLEKILAAVRDRQQVGRPARL